MTTCLGVMLDPGTCGTSADIPLWSTRSCRVGVLVAIGAAIVVISGEFWPGVRPWRSSDDEDDEDDILR